MAYTPGTFQEGLGWRDCSWQLKNKINPSSSILISTAIINNGATISIQVGHATLVNGKVVVTMVDSPMGAMNAPLVLNTNSRIVFSTSMYDNVDIPILSITARTNGWAGVATFTVSSKKNENSSFDFYVINY